MNDDHFRSLHLALQDKNLFKLNRVQLQRTIIVRKTESCSWKMINKENN